MPLFDAYIWYGVHQHTSKMTMPTDIKVFPVLYWFWVMPMSKVKPSVSAEPLHGDSVSDP